MKAKKSGHTFARCSRKVWGCILLGLVIIAFAGGCDRITRHKVLTTLFDGVPSLPPAEEIQKNQGIETPSPSTENTEAEKTLAGDKGSVHKPYAEKRCEDCHDFGSSNRLIKPAKKLCFVCHTDFIQGSHVHGPVSVGDCLACHLPHRSKEESLLLVDRAMICGTCHREKRLATRMHDKVGERDMVCVDCHDPHFGESHYFLN